MSLYAKLCLELETTLDEFDMTEIQKRRFEAEDEVESFQMSKASFSLSDDTI